MKSNIPNEILAQLLDLKLSPQAFAYIKACFDGVSRFPNGYSSSTVRYPSLLTHQVITAESRGFEFAFLLTIHAHPDAIWILEQPHPFQLVRPGGKDSLYYPDFLVIWRNRPPTIFEVKPSTNLAKRALKTPDVYEECEPGKFRAPLAEAAAQKLGLPFEVKSERNFNDVFLGNMKLLEPYRRWTINPAPADDETKSVIDQIDARPGITISELECGSPKRRADLVYQLIAMSRIFTHLEKEPLQNQNQVALFLEPIRQRAFETFHGTVSFRKATAAEFPYELKRGVQFAIGKDHYTISSVGADSVEFENVRGQHQSLSIASLLDLLPAVDAIHGAKKSLAEKLRLLNEDGLQEFLRRRQVVAPYIAGGELAGKTPADRSARRYLQSYREEVAADRPGEYGLIPRTDERGNTVSSIPPDVIELMDRYIVKHYLRMHPRRKRKPLFRRFIKILERTHKTGLPSYRTFVRYCNRWGAHRADLKRFGKKAAASSKIPFQGKSPMGNPNGLRPWDIVHCDHTTNDVTLDHPGAAEDLLKPVHSKMVDAADGRVLAWVTRLKDPSTMTIILLLRECARRHKTLPALVVVDWGPDLRSTWLQKTLALLGITLLYREKSNGPSGSPVENNNRIVDTRFIHQLSGSTEIMKRAREVSRNALPNNHAKWTLPALVKHYELFYKTYNSTPDRKTKLSPNDCSESLSNALGDHPKRCMREEMLHRALLPFADGITRTVSAKCTISVDRCTYGSSQLKHLCHKDVDVRIDPADPRVVYVFHPSLKELVECKAITLDIKYAKDANEAAEIAAITNASSPEVEKEIEDTWGSFEESIDEGEVILAQEKRARVRKPRKPKEEPPEADNVITFAISQGGMTRIAKQEVSS